MCIEEGNYTMEGCTGTALQAQYIVTQVKEPAAGNSESAVGLVSCTGVSNMEKWATAIFASNAVFARSIYWPFQTNHVRVLRSRFSRWIDNI